jgi:hypothetical protein
VFKYILFSVTGILALVLSIAAQTAVDTSLFDIVLNGDSTSLFYCKWGGGIRQTLSGPILMEGDRLLFYSDMGYLLYEQNGTLADSHSVFEDNKGLAPDSPIRLLLAQPVDPSTLLYWRQGAGDGKQSELYLRKIMKKRMKQLKDEEYTKFTRLLNAQLFNIAHNTITDEMSAKAYMEPNLVGFEGEKKMQQWWTLDKFYSFSSPVIHENGGTYGSFFPGIKSGMDASPEVKRSLVEPLATFERDGKRYYAGVYAAMGTVDDQYRQILYICDNAGNILYTDTLLKQSNIDAVLGESVEEKLYYTTRQTSKFVFQPAFASEGTVFYGIMDYESKKMTVRKRAYIAYRSKPATADLADLIDQEREITYEPVSISCIEAQQGGRTIPKLSYLDAKGNRRLASTPDLTKDEFVVRIFRQQYRDIDRKLASRRLQLSGEASAIRDSLAKDETAGCPYAISLSGPRGAVRSFDYSPRERVLCARVIAVTADRRVLVRVDLAAFAEILIFTPDGAFVNRFVFNNQEWKKRSDIIVASAKSPIIELDHESGGSLGTYLDWVPAVVER